MGGREYSAMISLFILLTTISYVFILLNSAIASNPSGFSIKILHRDSKESPLYPGDQLSHGERFQRLVKQSKDRVSYIELQISSFNRTTNSINPDIACLPLAYEFGSFYVALVGIGTFSNLPQTFKNYYLMVDSGTDLIWTQCQGGSSYFHQDEPIYPARDSSTYEPLLCNKKTKKHHPLCYPGRCDRGKCTYEVGYNSKSVTSGVLAKEKFTVISDNGALQSFDIVMGCGTKQLNFEPFFGSGFRRGNPDIIAGILGIGRGYRSFVNQLGSDGEGKFAYCLKSYTDGTAPSTYLRFGSDTTIGGEGQQVYATPLFFHPHNPNAYYLNLEDISIAGNRIGFQIKDFQYKEQTGRGGCMIDSGTPVTLMYEAHFYRVAEKVMAYFHGLNIHPVAAARRSYFDLCFLKPDKDFKYPTMTFHFQQQADFVLDKPDTIFSITDNDFCFGLIRLVGNPKIDVVLGTMQQARKRILYNVTGGSLLFAAEECEIGS